MSEKAVIDNLLKKCYLNWNILEEDARIREFKEALPLFLNEIGDDEELVMSLFDKFYYYSHIEINKKLEELYSKIKAINDYDEDYAIYTILKSCTDKLNSSSEYLLEFCKINDINKYNRFSGIDNISEEIWDNIKYIVLIDDFCGSGKTLKKYITRNKTRLEGKTVVYAVVHIMSQSLDIIQSEANELGLNVEVIFCDVSKKAFENFPDEKEQFILFSKNRGILDSDDILGFDKTESLIAYYNNTPNNTLGVFRRNTDKNVAVFPRKYDKKPAFLTEVKSKKTNRKISNYNNKVLMQDG